MLVLLARGAMAVLMPLSADEAYYWLWSKHPDFGYFDHPPMVAWLIRIGTGLFGDTGLGVRFAGLVLSVVASVLVWDAARTLLQDRARALTAALLFNLTLMIGVEMLAATPDMPSIVTSAALLACLARLQHSGNGRWWLAAGFVAGLGLLSKYSGLFPIAGAFLWLLASARGRVWLKTPWPWAGAVLTLLVFLPNLLWQAGHQWETFAFQFGRVAGGHLTARFLIEFVGAQVGLASPFILVLGLAGLGAALAQARRDAGLFLPAALMAPALAYFLVHALHDRVQGNWPCFLYPMLAVLAASACGNAPGWRRWCTRLAAPVGGLFLLAAYGQALFGFLPLGGADPLARLLGTGVRTVAGAVVAAAGSAHAPAVLTTDYETTAWLRFYEPGLKVVQVGQTWRYPNAPAPGPVLLNAPLLYLVEQRRDASAELEKSFATVSLATQLQVGRGGRPMAVYRIYLVETQKGPVAGRMP